MRALRFSAVWLALVTAAAAQQTGSSQVPLPNGAAVGAPAWQPSGAGLPQSSAVPAPGSVTSGAMTPGSMTSAVAETTSDQARTITQRSFAIGLEAVPDLPNADRTPGLSGVPMPLSADAVPSLPAIDAPILTTSVERGYRTEPPAPIVPQVTLPLVFSVPKTEITPASPPKLASQPLPPAIAVEPPPVTAPVIPRVPAAVPAPPAAPQAITAAPWGERLERALGRISGLAPALPAPVIAGIRQFYETRGDRHLFAGNGAVQPRGNDVLKVVRQAASHGLDQERFARLTELAAAGNDDEKELAIATLAVAYARDARGARLNPAQVSRLITATPTIPDPAPVLDGLAAAADASTALEGWNPQHEGYRMLRAALARAAGSEVATGQGRSAALAGDIIANMERWRWLPVSLGSAHVMVNIPAYRLEMKREGRVMFETRVVVGKPSSPTPVFSHEMEYLVVNPYWNVPPSITLKEYLPLLRANPYALQARGLEVVSRGRVIDPASIDWSKMPRSVAIRQPPGERNALGHIKFMFPNDHAVYLHDTPSRGLFSSSRRAFSHGCVRVQNPFALATAISGWSEGRLRAMVGGAERRLDLPGDVAVHLAYFTLEGRDDGALVAREDIYGHHRRMKRLMGL